MKILIVNTVAKEGSTGKIVTELYKEYVREGYECIVAYGRGEGNSELNTYKIGNRLDSVLHATGTRILDNHGLLSKQVTKKFINFIEDFKPNIIHLHNIHGYYINMNLLFRYLKNKDIKIIWTMHDCWAISPGAAYIDYLDDGSLPNGLNFSKNDKNQYPATLFYRRSYRNYFLKKELFTGLKNIQIITPSNWLNNLLQKSFLKDYPINTIYNGIHMETFTKEKSNIDYKGLRDKKIILGVANIWDERKGLNFFNELAQNLPNYQIVIVGDIQKKEVHPRIFHINKTSSIDELVNLYKLADVFVNPTIADNFPTTNLESLASGTPIVAFDIGGNSEVIDDKVGKIVDLNFNSLIAGVEYVINSDKSFYLQNCKLKSINFSKEEMCRNYIEIVKESDI